MILEILYFEAFFLIYIVDVNWVHFKVQIHTFHLIEVNMFDLMDLNG